MSFAFVGLSAWPNSAFLWKLRVPFPMQSHFSFLPPVFKHRTASPIVWLTSCVMPLKHMSSLPLSWSLHLLPTAARVTIP
jgi:hypothetical protein